MGHGRWSLYSGYRGGWNLVSLSILSHPQVALGLFLSNFFKSTQIARWAPNPDTVFPLSISALYLTPSICIYVLIASMTLGAVAMAAFVEPEEWYWHLTPTLAFLTQLRILST